MYLMPGVNIDPIFRQFPRPLCYIRGSVDRHARFIIELARPCRANTCFDDQTLNIGHRGINPPRKIGNGCIWHKHPGRVGQHDSTIVRGG